MSASFDLRSARLNKGLTQRALATKTKVPLATVQRLEEGLGARPSNALKLAEFFKVQVTDLMSPDPADRSVA